jgi:hypothetical protein
MDNLVRNNYSRVKTYQEFKEFTKQEKEKIAATIEKKSTTTFLSPTVEDYIYFTNRALDYGDFDNYLPKTHIKRGKWEKSVNKNADLFTASEIHSLVDEDKIKRYETFRKALLYENHKSSDPSLSIGVIFDVYDISNVTDDDEMHLTLLSGLDSKRAPNIARAMRTYPERIASSMGAKIKSSYCTCCGKVVKSDADICTHLRFHRNARVAGVKCAEVLQGFEFIEDSIVTTPACSSAYVLDAVKDLTEVLGGKPRLLKVAGEQIEEDGTLYLMSNIYSRIKSASNVSEKKRLANQLDLLIFKLESMLD